MTTNLMQRLKMFLDTAAGEGYVFNGIDAADLYVALFGYDEDSETV